MFVDQLKQKASAAMKARDTVAKDVLRVALGEIQTAEARAGQSLSEDDAQKIVRKLVKSNEETLAAVTDATVQAKLRREIEVLSGLLPQALSVDEIVRALQPLTDQIRGAKADGPAMGMAMKHLKGRGAVVESEDVKAAVAQIRAG
ncbi:MAG: GatB/YqeY domain-containing protein [Myxococcota bacterium]